MSSPRFDWYQVQNSVFVDIFIKNLTSKDVSVEFTSRTVHLNIDNDQAQFDKIFELSELIKPEESKFSIGKVKLEIELAKNEGGKVWKSLEEQESENSGVPKYPSSARNPMDSSKFDESEFKDAEPTGEAAINALFQKIYSDSSEDTRRAMMKSFIESKGTVLSTNWEEVGEKVIEPIPPKNN